MKIKLNRGAFRNFLMRRRVNFMSLLAMTGGICVITVICALLGFARAHLMAVVCVLMIVLCLIYAAKLRGSFTTIRRFRGIRRRSREKESG